MPLKVELIPGDSRYVCTTKEFPFRSAILDMWCEIPVGFIFDLESVPLLRGSNPEAGAVHDYLCRIDSRPVVTKWQAAQVYFDIQDYFDEKESGNWINRGWDWICRQVKTGVVIVAPGYFHKYKVMATYEEIVG
jgi:hypothetical protein